MELKPKPQNTLFTEYALLPLPINTREQGQTGANFMVLLLYSRFFGAVREHKSIHPCLCLECCFKAAASKCQSMPLSFSTLQSSTFTR
eukprot:380238-Amphidinium_carterae.1